LVRCEFCGGKAIFVRHEEQHLGDRVVDVCRACHMKIHLAFCKEPRFTQSVFLVGRGERSSVTIHVPKSLLAEFQEFCHDHGFSMSLIITVGLHYFNRLTEALVRSDVELPVETIAKIAGLSARVWMEWAEKAYEIYEPPIKWGISKVEVFV